MQTKRAIPQKAKATQVKAVTPSKKSTPRITCKPKSTPKSKPKPATLPAAELIEPVTAAETRRQELQRLIPAKKTISRACGIPSSIISGLSRVETGFAAPIKPAAALADVTPEVVEAQAKTALAEPTAAEPTRYCQRMSIGLSTYQAQKFLLAQRLADKIDSLVASIVPEESGRYDLCILAEIVEAGSSKP